MRKILVYGTSPLAYRDLDIPGWPDIDPLTVLAAFDDWARDEGVEVRQETLDKALAVQTVLMTELPFVDAYAFEKTVEAFNGRSPMFGYWPTAPMPAELALTVEAMRQLRPQEEFGINVKRYIREILGYHGVGTWPASMEFLVEEHCRGFDPDVCHEISEGKTELAKVQRGKLDDIADYVKERIAA